MRSVLLASLVLAAAAAPASAMGVYIDVDLVAWNTDGTAALLSRSQSSSGTVGSSMSYTLISSADGSRLDVSFDDTLDPDTRTQKVDVATCTRAAKTLQKALSDKRFTGLSILPEHCGSDRAVVQARPAVTKSLVSGKVGDLNARVPADTRELRVADALKLALGSFPTDAVVQSLTGDLIIILSGENGDSSGPAHAEVIATGKRAPRILIGDLRAD